MNSKYQEIECIEETDPVKDFASLLFFAALGSVLLSIALFMFCVYVL